MLRPSVPKASEGSLLGGRGSGEQGCRGQGAEGRGQSGSEEGGSGSGRVKAPRWRKAKASRRTDLGARSESSTRRGRINKPSFWPVCVFSLS